MKCIKDGWEFEGTPKELRELIEGVTTALEDNPSITQIEETIKKKQVRPYRHWTAAQDRRLRQMRNQGMTVKEIAARLARTPNAVTVRLHRR